VAAAGSLLGYAYPLAGVVVKGDQLGRTLGFPTANIGAIDPDKLVPGEGVYAVTVELFSARYKGMLYIGQRPTLHNTMPQLTVEVNIFDLDRDLYGERIVVRFMQRIRADKRFQGLEGLREQLHRDRVAAMELLGNKT
jgi:riboflavin kinase/FMN adenylyltransferase